MIVHVIYLLLIFYLLWPRMEIPRIIHQLAPADKSKWNSGWEECQKTWMKFHPDFEYRMWTDEDIFEFMKKEDPEFYESVFLKYPKNIQRWDAVRPFILYKYGGIYADMDYECNQRFYELLPRDKISICESISGVDEGYQNALMVSPKHHVFWKKLIKDMENVDTTDTSDPVYVQKTTGPTMISRCIKHNSTYINTLTVSEYYNGIYARHRNNGVWSFQ